MTIPLLPQQAQKSIEVIKVLVGAGYTAHLVGGAVRNLLLGLPVKDFDIATDATPEQVASIFQSTNLVGASFGVTLVQVEKENIEVATWRTETAYADGRHPDEVQYSNSLDADASRRDFTVNALYLDPINSNIIDTVGGLEDIKSRTLRAVGNPDDRFKEDGLRLLRAARFSAACGLTIEPDTKAGLRKNSKMINAVSDERIGIELTKIVTCDAADYGVELLQKHGILDEIIPEAIDMVGMPQPEIFHPEGCVWTHTLLCLKHLENPTAALAFATLLHDIGKPQTYKKTDRIRFHGHAEVGAKIASTICERLRLSKSISNRVVELISQHQKFYDVKNMRKSTLHRFFRQDCFPELLALYRVDKLGGNGNLDNWQWCKDKYESMNLNITPLLNGADLQKLGLEPGPKYGKILRELESEQLEGKITTKEQAVEFVLKRIS